MRNTVQTTAPPSEADTQRNQPQTRRDFIASNPPPPDIIDQPELLRRVPISRRTCANWEHAEKLPFIKIGRRKLYHWPSVEAALLRQQQEAGK